MPAVTLPPPPTAINSYQSAPRFHLLQLQVSDLRGFKDLA